MDDHTNARFEEADFSGARFHGVVFSKVKISDAWLHDVDISGHIAGSLLVNGIDVSGYVDSELKKRYPELALLAPFDPDGMRAAWALVEDFSAATVERARALPSEKLDESVDGEWSFLETQRHLVFATDRWITGPVLGEKDWFHPLGMPNPPLDEVPAGVFDLDAKPTLDEVLAMRRGRMDRVAELVKASTPTISTARSRHRTAAWSPSCTACTSCSAKSGGTTNTPTATSRSSKAAER